MRNFLRQILFRNRFFLTKNFCGGNTRHRTRARKRSLRSDRAFVLLGHYVATELYRNIDMTISPWIFVYPRSQRDREKLLFRMLQSRKKLLGSGLLIRVSPWIIELTSSETVMTLCSAPGKLLDTMSFTYFFIEGDTFMASLSGISSVLLSNAFLQIALSNCRLVCVLLGGKGGKSPIHSLYHRFGRSRASIDIYRGRSIDIVSFLSIDFHIFFQLLLIFIEVDSCFLSFFSVGPSFLSRSLWF